MFSNDISATRSNITSQQYAELLRKVLPTFEDRALRKSTVCADLVRLHDLLEAAMYVEFDIKGSDSVGDKYFLVPSQLPSPSGVHMLR